MKAVNKILEIIGSVFVIMAIVIMILNIILRALFGFPLPGSYELTGLCAATFIAASIARGSIAGTSISVDLFVSRIHGIPRKILRYVAELCNLTVALVITFSSWDLTMKMIQVREKTESVGVPIWPVRVFWLLCTATMAVFSVVKIIVLIREAKQDAAESEEVAETEVQS